MDLSSRCGGSRKKRWDSAYNLKVKLARFPVRHVKKESIRDVSSFGLRNWTTWLPVTRWKRLWGTGLRRQLGSWIWDVFSLKDLLTTTRREQVDR